MNAPGVQRPRQGARLLSRAAVERVILIVVVTGSLWAIWYSVSRLLALQAKTRTLNRQVAQLYADIDTMRSHWSGSRTQEVAQRFNAVPESLFPNEASIAEWTESIQRDSVPLALETRFRLNGTQVSTNGARPVTRILATIDVNSNPTVASPRPVYHRLLDWSRQVAMQARRVDLVELNVTGVASDAGSASATVELWSQEQPQPQATP